MSADSVVWLSEHSLFAVLNSHFWCWDCDSYLLKEANQAIFFSMVGLPLFGQEGSGTSVFEILRRAQGPSWPRILGRSDFSLQEN